MKTNPNLINIAGIRSFKNVQTEIKLLNANLQSENMSQFKLFNEAYLIVTNHIQTATKNNYFENPKFIEKFTTTFATYYFKAINDTLTGSKDLTMSWAAMDKLNLKTSPRFISLLMGANAHINNDLPRVLNRLMEKEDTENLLSDIVKIDKLLMLSGKEIIDLFDETNKKLNFLKRYIKFIYYRPIMYMILYWRVIAWRNYRKIKKNNATLTRVNKRSDKIANRFLRIAKLLA
jgi:hypothetical protein